MTKRMHTKLSVLDSFFKSYLVLNYSKSAHLVRKSSWGGSVQKAGQKSSNNQEGCTFSKRGCGSLQEAFTMRKEYL